MPSVHSQAWKGKKGLATGTEPWVSLPVLGEVKHVPWLQDPKLIFSTWSVSGAVDVSPDFDHPFASGPQGLCERCTWETTIGAQMWEGQQKKKFPSSYTYFWYTPCSAVALMGPNEWLPQIGKMKLGSLPIVTKLRRFSNLTLAYYSATVATRDYLSCNLKVKLVVSAPSRIAKTWLV